MSNTAKAVILWLTALGSVFHRTASQELDIEIDIPGDRKYLVIGESVDNFLYCNAVNVTLLSDVFLCLLSSSSEGFFQINNETDSRYKYDCQGTAKNARCAYSVSQVQRKDAGIYKCTLESCDGLVSTTLYVPVYDEPLIDRVTASPADGSVRETYSFTFICFVNVPVEGTAGLSMEWRRNSTMVESQSELSDFMYSVQSAKIEDSGNYSCTVLNGSTEVDTSPGPVAIDVTYYPKITTFLVRTPDGRLYPSKEGVFYVNAGENATLECTAEGNPVPFVMIFHQGTKDVSVMESSEGRTSTALRNITRAEKSRDSGEYICGAHNGMNPPGDERLDLVIYETAVITYFDLVNEDTTNLAGCRNVTGGERQTLKCIADGEPRPVIVILDEGGKQVAYGVFNEAYYHFVAKKNETYICLATTTVTNETTNASLSLCPSSSKSFTVTIVAASLGSAGFVVGVLVALLFRKRCTQPKQRPETEPKPKTTKNFWKSGSNGKDPPTENAPLIDHH